MKGSVPGGRRAATHQFCGVSIAVACLISLTTTACRHSTDSALGISIIEQIAPQPVHVGEATVDVQLADAKGNPVTDATIMVEADMAHPGMSPTFKTAIEAAPGNYQAQMNFTMAGDWVLLLHIKLADGTKIERQMDVRGVRPN